ncbi:MAG: hypothetical protein BTN85_0216 [Candidatus Methanohalarchaeum thermophilum]|uniref:Uncharacterized protein n=1 Tax=Methanohalarchaeum thermophilum TaxID=1903181 RepID=A0A1Q6DTS5_METT1|nr:MAG: hypothetical protein BTN85_0216 [Candidatus Methanohalarchaeum thermophilum]
MNNKKEYSFLIFISFLVSFTLARVYVFFFSSWGTGRDFFPLENYFIHHLYYGIGFLIVSGWLAINYEEKRIKRFSSIVYGLGLGLFLDEIGLMLTHFENYWDSITYTFFSLTGLIFLNLIFFEDFWNEVGADLKKYLEEKKIYYGPFNLMKIVDILEVVNEKMPKSSKLADIFLGVILFVSGILVLKYPSLIYYWVAGAFFLSAISYFVKAVKEI